MGFDENDNIKKDIDKSTGNKDIKNETKIALDEARAILDAVYNNKRSGLIEKFRKEYKDLQNSITDSLKQDRNITKNELTKIKLELSDIIELKNGKKNLFSQVKNFFNKEDLKGIKKSTNELIEKNIDNYSKEEAIGALEYLNQKYLSYKGENKFDIEKVINFKDKSISELDNRIEVRYFQDELINKILSNKKGYNNEYIKGFDPNNGGNYLTRISTYENKLIKNEKIGGEITANYISYLNEKYPNKNDFIKNFIGKFGNRHSKIQEVLNIGESQQKEKALNILQKYSIVKEGKIVIDVFNKLVKEFEKKIETIKEVIKTTKSKISKPKEVHKNNNYDYDSNPLGDNLVLKELGKYDKTITKVNNIVNPESNININNKPNNYVERKSINKNKNYIKPGNEDKDVKYDNKQKDNKKTADNENKTIQKGEKQGFEHRKGKTKPPILKTKEGAVYVGKIVDGIPIIKTGKDSKIKKPEIVITAEEFSTINSNPKTMENFIYFHDLFEELNLKSVWKYRSDIIKAMRNSGLNIDYGDNGITKNELINFGNSLIKFINKTNGGKIQYRDNNKDIGSIRNELLKYSGVDSILEKTKTFGYYGEDRFAYDLRKSGIIQEGMKGFNTYNFENTLKI